MDATPATVVSSAGSLSLASDISQGMINLTALEFLSANVSGQATVGTPTTSHVSFQSGGLFSATGGSLQVTAASAELHASSGPIWVTGSNQLLLQGKNVTLGSDTGGPSGAEVISLVVSGSEGVFSVQAAESIQSLYGSPFTLTAQQEVNITSSNDLLLSSAGNLSVDSTGPVSVTFSVLIELVQDTC